MSADLAGVGANGGGDASVGGVVRLVEAHSGVSDVLGSERGVERLTETVAHRLEGGRPGTRFPLLRVLLRRGPVSAAECDALAREVVRLRAALAGLPPDDAPDARRTGDPALEAAAPLSPPPAPAELYARTLSVVEQVARLGGASRRGVRIEVGPEAPASPPRARLGLA